MQRTSRCDPIQVSQWKRQLLDGASELFTRGMKTKDKDEGQAKEAELFQQIERLQMELKWLKKSLSCSIDALYLEHPCSGSRRMVDYLAREGTPISHDRVRNLMHCMGFRAILEITASISLRNSRSRPGRARA